MHSNFFKKAVSFFIFLTVVLSGALYFKNAQAADLAIRCRDDESSCSSEPSNAPLFNETAVAPGQVITKTFSARNEKSGVCDLKLSVTSAGANSDFSKAMFTSITSERGDEFGVSLSGVATSAKNFSDVVAASPIDLGSIDPYNSKNFSWSVKFSEGATNALQGARTNFDIGLNFQCDEPSGNSRNESSSSSESGTTGVVAGKTVKKTSSPTPTASPSILGKLFEKIKPDVLGATENNLISPSITSTPGVAGASTESNSSNNLSVNSFFPDSWYNWLWILIVILLLVIAYLLFDKYSKKKSIK